MLLGFEAAGGLVLFGARLALGTSPGESLHVIGGLALTMCYAAYQWRHWNRVRPFRARPDYALGLVAALSMAAVNGTGLALAVFWWRDRWIAHAAAWYPPALSAAHNIGSMLVLAFVGAHLGAVLLRERRAAGA